MRAESGALVNMSVVLLKVAEQRGPIVSQHVISVSDHKTTTCHGPAKIVVNPTLWGWLQVYVKHFLSQVCSKHVLCTDNVL